MSTTTRTEATRTGIAPATPVAVLSPMRLHLMRAAYLLMGVGLVLVKWPLVARAHELPLDEGVVVCLLSAMALLALVGVRHPVAMLPLLVFETTWKLLWLAAVALPLAVSGRLDAATVETAVSCSLVVVVIVATPWRWVWQGYVRTIRISHASSPR
jgi:hypothetical protein